MIARWLFSCLLIVLLPAAICADVAYPTGREPFNLDYQLIYQHAVSSGRFYELPTVGPFYYSTVKQLYPGGRLSPSMRLIETTDDHTVRLFSMTSERYRAQRHTGGQNYPLLVGGLRYQPSAYLGTLVLFNLDREKALDPDYSGKKWRGLAGGIETAAIYFKKGNLGLTLGRQRVFWGPQPVNLILSETAEPLDLLSATYRKGRLGLNFIFARLDGSRPDSLDFVRFPDRTFQDNRYLVGHRLDIQLHRLFRIGLFETMVFGGPGRPPELYYLNPLQFFHSAQLNEDIDDNTIFGLDFTFIPWNRISLYGQLMIDDFQIDRRVQGDQEPDEIGIMAGLYRAGSPGRWSPDLKFEYVRITNRTYHTLDPRNRYLFRNKLIGHPLGPDADSLSLMVRLWLSVRQSMELEIAHTRHGEGSIYKSWDTPWAETQGDYDEPFLTGVVEKSTVVAARYRGYLPISKYTSEHIFVSLAGRYGSIKNQGNVSGNDATIAELNVAISWIGFMQVGLEE